MVIVNIKKNRQMKNIFKAAYLLPMLAASMIFASCQTEEGEEPGNDNNPVATLYSYKVDPPMNTDNDVKITVAANSATQEAYILAEKTDDYDKNLQEKGENGYSQYVVENGSRLSKIAGASEQDTTITDLQGDYTITVVAKSGNTLSAQSTTFRGLIWSDVTEGTFYPMYQLTDGSKQIPEALGFKSKTTTLQKCENEEGLYRLKDVYGKGYSLKFNIFAQGEGYQILSVSAQSTGKSFGKYGVMSVRDVGTWQGNDDYKAENQLYPNGSIQLWNEYFVTGGYIAYGYDFFRPAK